MEDTNIKVTEFALQELEQPTGNVAFQNDADFVKQFFLAGKYVKIQGEERIYHESEAVELFKHIKELKALEK